MPRPGQSFVQALTACAFAACGASANAQIAIVQDVRFVSASADALANGVADHPGPINRTRPTFGADWTSNNSVSSIASVPGASMAVSAIHLSTITSSQLTAQGSISMSTSIAPNAVSPATVGNGTSRTELLFDVPLGASIDVVSSVTGVGVVLLEVSNGATLFSGSGVASFASPATRLRLLAYAASPLNGPPSGSQGGAYSVSVTVVPTPGAGLFLAAGCLFGAFRRRRAS